MNTSNIKSNDFLFLQLVAVIALLFYFIVIPLYFLIRDKRKQGWSEKYINGYIDDLSKIKFKRTIFVLFLFIFSFSIIYLFWGIFLSFKHQALSLKLIDIAFSGLVTLGTLLMALSSFYSIKELRYIEKKREDLMLDKEESRKNQVIKIFFNQIKKYLKDLRIISDEIISSEVQGLNIFADTKIQKIFYDFYKIPTIFEDIIGYNSLFFELKSPCEPIFREYYHSFYNFIQDTKNINNELISRFGLISDKNTGSIFEYIYAQTKQNTLQNISDELLKKYENYCRVNNKNPCKLKEFINSLYTPYLLNLRLSDPFPKLKSFVEYPIFLIILGYESLFCIMKEHSIIDSDSFEWSSIINDYREIESKIKEISGNGTVVVSDVVRESLAKIKSINENYKDYLILKAIV